MNIYDFTQDELREYFVSKGEKPYRASQVYKKIYKGIPIEDMTDLPKALREMLSAEFDCSIPKIERRLKSNKDFVIKYLFRLSDGECVEGVVMEYKHGLSMCVSTQVGCRMGCSFCASTLHGLKRNLTAGEISGQIMAAERDLDRRVSSIVLMGSGEPFDNFDNVLKFIKNTVNPDGLGIGARHITISTCGLTDGIKRLAECTIPINLSISLHAPNDELRRSIMPIARAVSINDLINEANNYREKTGRRVTYEYSLIKGVNDSRREAEELAGLLRGTDSHVNLIPVNEVAERRHQRSMRAAQFRRELEGYNVNATIRRELGADINASCGQLRNEYEASKERK